MWAVGRPWLSSVGAFERKDVDVRVRASIASELGVSVPLVLVRYTSSEGRVDTSRDGALSDTSVLHVLGECSSSDHDWSMWRSKAVAHLPRTKAGVQ
eukprot:15432471-Alexandrium_andersonii.AAC.1